MTTPSRKAVPMASCDYNPKIGKARFFFIVRSERDDWDLASGVATIRQKKADKSKSFTRRNAPIHPALSDA